MDPMTMALMLNGASGAGAGAGSGAGGGFNPMSLMKIFGGGGAQGGAQGGAGGSGQSAYGVNADPFKTQMQNKPYVPVAAQFTNSNYGDMIKKALGGM